MLLVQQTSNTQMNTFNTNQTGLTALTYITGADMEPIFKKYGESSMRIGEWTGEAAAAPDYYKVGMALDGSKNCLSKVYFQLGDLEQAMILRYFGFSKRDGKFFMKFFKWLLKRNLLSEIHTFITDDTERKQSTQNWNTKNEVGFFLSLSPTVQNALINKYCETTQQTADQHSTVYDIMFESAARA